MDGQGHLWRLIPHNVSEMGLVEIKLRDRSKGFLSLPIRSTEPCGLGYWNLTGVNQEWWVVMFEALLPRERERNRERKKDRERGLMIFFPPNVCSCSLWRLISLFVGQGAHLNSPQCTSPHLSWSVSTNWRCQAAINKGIIWFSLVCKLLYVGQKANMQCCVFVAIFSTVY